MANKRLSAIISIGGAVSSSFFNATKQTQSSISRVGDAVSKLTARQRELNQVVAQQERLGSSGSAMRVQYAQQELAQIDKRIAKLRQVQALESKSAALSKSRADIGGAIRTQVGQGLAIGALVAAPVVAAARFETAMLGIAKQVEGARDESGKLTSVYYQMGDAIKQLSREIPLTTTDLAAMVTAGARMGVAKDQLIEFTKTSAMMAEAFEMPAAELADSMGKIAGLYKIPIPAISSLADAINYLDDNAISKGGDIIDFMQRTGGIAGSVKIGATQMAALGSTLLTLGERTETAGTATNAMFQKFAAADKGTKKFKAAMNEIGMSTAKVQKGMQTDAQGTILTVLEAINKLPKDKQLGVMVELVGLEHSDTLAKLANGVAEYRKQIALAGSDKAKGSMSREFQARMETTEAQFKLVGNAAGRLAVSIGGVFMAMGGPGGLPAMIDSLTSFVDENRQAIGTVVKIGGAMFGMKLAFNVARYAVVGTQAAIVGTRLAMTSLPAVAAAAGTALRVVGSAVLFVGRALLLNPIGLAVTAIAGGAYLVVKNWTPIKAFFKSLWDDVTGIFDKAITWIMDKVQLVFNAIDRVKAGATSVGNLLGLGDAVSAPQAAGAGTMQYDAMGNPTGYAASELPQPAMRSGTTTVNNTTNVAPATVVVNAKDANAKEVAAEVDRLLKRRREVEGRSRLYDGTNQ